MTPSTVNTTTNYVINIRNQEPVTKEQIYADGRELGFADNAIRVMEKRYLVRNEDGKVIETPKGMYRRVARALAAVEARYGATETAVKEWEEKFYTVLSRFEFTPAGRTVTNAGAPTRLISNCIVLHFDDSMESIFATLRDAALLQQAGSGLGFAWHLLRPAGQTTVASRGMASGPVSFLHAYNTAFGVIKQQCFAKGTRIVTRRGLLPIEEVTTRDETYTEKGWKRVTELFNNGLRETVRLTLDTGFSIEVTPGHKIAVITDNAIVLKEVKELTSEDTLLLKLGDEQDEASSYCALKTVEYVQSKYTSFQLQKIRQPHELNEDLAYLLGWYFADGWNDTQGIGLVIPDDDVVEQKARGLLDRLFGTRVVVSQTPGERCRKLNINSLWVKRFLEENSLLKQHAHEITVPEHVLRSPKQVQMAYIAGFFDGDGDNGKNYRLSTTSSVFAQQLLRILLVSGIGAKILTTVYQGEHAHWRPLYRLSIIGKESTERFFAKIQKWSWKIQKKETAKDFGWIFPFHPVRDLGFTWGNIQGLHDGVRNTMSHGALTQVQERATTVQAVAAQDRVDWTGFLPARVARIEPVGQQEVYDFEVENVHMINAGLYTSNSRHGANMGVMRVDHPDILEFIDCKRKEGDLVNFNVSVSMTDAFMKAAQSDSKEPWLCEWQGKKMKPRLIKRNNRGVYVSHEDVTLTARELMDRIVESAWTNGEPGVLFPDAANRTNPVPHLGRLEATNPCVTGDTLIATAEGLQRADVLAQGGRTLRVATDGRFGSETLQNASPVFPTGEKDIFRVTTQEGYEVRCTSDHQMMTTRGWVEAGTLRAGDRLHIMNRKGGFGIGGTLEEGRILGWLVGDGTISAIRAVLSFFGDEKRELAPAFAHAVTAVVAGVGQSGRKVPVGVIAIRGRDEARVMSERLRVWAADHGLTEEDHKRVPHTVFTGSEAMMRGFLQALFTADGSVQDVGEKGISVRLASSYEELLTGAQLLLLNFGIASRIYRNRRPAQIRQMPDGRGSMKAYHCRAQHELVITKQSLERFAVDIGFCSETKQSALLDGLATRTKRGLYREPFTATVARVVSAGREMVYDLTEPVTHSFIANGIVVHNCGEQWLHDGDVCNLGSINLATFVKDGQVDEIRLRDVTRLAMRMLDNVIDLSDFPAEKVNKRFRENRRVGLGIMGFADMLYQLHVPYNSPQGFATAERVMQIVNDASHEESESSARTKGVFPNWEKSIFGPHGQNRLQRNAALTTVAPTGSISMLLDCSSGVEPFFALAYVKENIMGGDSLTYFNKYLEAELKRLGLYAKELVDDVVRTGSIQHRTDLPEDLRRTFVTAMDISAEDHIRMQAAFQKHVDNSISKTINFKHSATRDDVRNGYIMAWELGCKGGTVYRDGSRQEQVLSVQSQKEPTAKAAVTASTKPVTADAPPVAYTLKPRPRPSRTYGATYEVKTGYGDLYVTINSDAEGRPFEVFATIGKTGGVFAAKSEAICRLISLALRSGIDVKTIIKQLKGIRGPMPTWTKKGMVLSIPDAIAQIMDEHMKDGQMQLFNGKKEPAMLAAPAVLDMPVHVQQPSHGSIADFGVSPICPDCANILVMAEGCMSCKACGFSRCG